MGCSLHDVTVGDDAASSAAKGATETLTQLLAKILNQLSLSAWLPSAALVLIVTFAFNLAEQVGGREQPVPLSQALGPTIASLSNIGFGGVTLLVMVVVVTTMLTQAFAFVSIRVLEGYWGTSKYLDRIASKKCSHHHGVRDGLAERYKKLSQTAWQQVEAIASAETRPGGSEPRFSPAMLSKLEELVLGTLSEQQLSNKEQGVVDRYEWDSHVDNDTLRQRRVVGNRLSDYPAIVSHIMPTRLGNILRRYEDDTHQDDVEHFVERVYDSLPFTMQLSHDEQRTRLDLYCSMAFVLWFAAITSSLGFDPSLWRYWVGSIVLAACGSTMTYFAAIATARHYGSILAAISEWSLTTMIKSQP